VLIAALVARKYERVCSNCGASWLVPRSMARGRRRGFAVTPAGGDLPDVATHRQIFFADEGLPEAVLGRLSRSAARQAYRICPKCGADNFIQHPA
jgi:ribosomal protein S27AE